MKINTSQDCLGKFANQKLSCVRFLPGRQFLRFGDDGEECIFVTGSWENQAENAICLWKTNNANNDASKMATFKNEGDVNKIEVIFTNKTY